MFREMRRKKQELSKEECIDILQTAKTAVLGVVGDDGYPYTVPINFVYANSFCSSVFANSKSLAVA